MNTRIFKPCIEKGENETFFFFVFVLFLILVYFIASQEANLVEEVEDSPQTFGPDRSSPITVPHRFFIGLDRSTNGPLPDCDRKYVSVRTMPPGMASIISDIDHLLDDIYLLGNFIPLEKML